jgi:hypothetical protein
LRDLLQRYANLDGFLHALDLEISAVAQEERSEFEAWFSESDD